MEKLIVFLYPSSEYMGIKNTKPFIITQKLQQQSDCCSRVSQLLESPVLREDTSPP